MNDINNDYKAALRVPASKLAKEIMEVYLDTNKDLENYPTSLMLDYVVSTYWYDNFVNDITNALFDVIVGPNKFELYRLEETFNKMAHKIKYELPERYEKDLKETIQYKLSQERY